jgi:hypothetical protein
MLSTLGKINLEGGSIEIYFCTGVSTFGNVITYLILSYYEDYRDPKIDSL